MHVCRSNISLAKISSLSLHVKCFLAINKICLEKEDQIGK